MPRHCRRQAGYQCEGLIVLTMIAFYFAVFLPPARVVYRDTTAHGVPWALGLVYAISVFVVPLALCAVFGCLVAAFRAPRESSDTWPRRAIDYSGYAFLCLIGCMFLLMLGALAVMALMAVWRWAYGVVV